MDKLPSKKFDVIYEGCMKSGGGEKGTYNDSTFYGHVYHIAGEDTWSKYVAEFGRWNKDLLEAYHSGEIRDRGAMDEPNAPNERDEWYKLDPAVFDGLVDDPIGFQYRVHIKNSKLWNMVCSPQGFIVGDSAHALVALYKAGILRRGGALNEKVELLADSTIKYLNSLPPYDDVFSVKDGQMRVDWDALKVTKENALEISIASWKWAYAWMQENCEKLGRDATQCALCEIYRLEASLLEGWCVGCPVRQETERSGCAGTPFEQYEKPSTQHEALDACRDEIAFLEGLRETP